MAAPFPSMYWKGRTNGWIEKVKADKPESAAAGGAK
jgi:hypothetical protein